jgi:hypothetical protein
MKNTMNTTTDDHDTVPCPPPPPDLYGPCDVWRVQVFHNGILEADMRTTERATAIERYNATADDEYGPGTHVRLTHLPAGHTEWVLVTLKGSM